MLTLCPCVEQQFPTNMPAVTDSGNNLNLTIPDDARLLSVLLTAEIGGSTGALPGGHRTSILVRVSYSGLQTGAVVLLLSSVSREDSHTAEIGGPGESCTHVQNAHPSVLTCLTNRAVARLHQLHSRQVAAYTASRCDGRPWIAGSSGFRLVLDQSNFALNVSEASQNGVRFINTHRQVPNDRFVSLCFA